MAALLQRGPEGGPNPRLDKQALYPSSLLLKLSLLFRGKESRPSLLPDPILVSQCLWCQHSSGTHWGKCVRLHSRGDSEVPTAPWGRLGAGR